MKMARIIGRVTLSVQDPSFGGARFVIGQPWHPTHGTVLPAAGEPLPKGNSLVIYDALGASPGDIIGYSDGGEAAAPFADDTPCDAYCCALLDQITYQAVKTL
jgi:microcompartment protein CcmK/EutM